MTHRVRFVLDRRFLGNPVLAFLARTGRVIPADFSGADQAPAASVFAAIADALSADELVLIFPEGSVSADGTLRPFQPWLADILEKSPVPVIPLALSGLWGSVFSRHDARLIRRLRQLRLLRAVTLAVGPASTGGTPQLLQQQVAKLLRAGADPA